MFKSLLFEVIIKYFSFIHVMHTGQFYMCTFQISKKDFYNTLKKEGGAMKTVSNCGSTLREGWRC